MAIRLESERLILKSFEKADAKSYFDLLMRNYDFFKPWSPEYGTGYKDYELHIPVVERDEKNTETGTGIKFGMYKSEDTSVMIGTCAVSSIVRGPFLSCFLGYRVDENENGKGYATEAINTVVKYVFDELKLHRIEANIMPRNNASIKTIEKCGFTCEGESKKYLQINGVWEDHLHYVILNDAIENIVKESTQPKTN